jgi:hypothetical protein
MGPSGMGEDEYGVETGGEEDAARLLRERMITLERVQYYAMQQSTRWVLLDQGCRVLFKTSRTNV